jgi:hypothetical protein
VVNGARTSESWRRVLGISSPSLASRGRIGGTPQSAPSVPLVQRPEGFAILDEERGVRAAGWRHRGPQVEWGRRLADAIRRAKIGFKDVKERTIRERHLRQAMLSHATGALELHDGMR